MGGSRALVLFVALVLAACSDAPPITVEDGSIRQYVSTIREQRDPTVKILVLDDRDVRALDPLLSPRNGVIERELVSLATGVGAGKPRIEDYPREVALVLVFPASGKVAAAPEVPALHVRSPAFGDADAKAMSDAIRAAVASAASAPRLARYEPIEMTRDVEALVAGTREARTPEEARIAADVAGLRADYGATVVTAPFDGMRDSVPKEGGTLDLVLLGECPLELGGRCREPHAGPGLFWPAGSHRSALPIPGWALRPDGSASCVVEVAGVGLGCESRGWSRLGRPGRSDERETCTVPQLEGAAKAECRDGVRCDSCGAGFCVGMASGPHLRFTKRAFPHELDAEIRVVCTH